MSPLRSPISIFRILLCAAVVCTSAIAHAQTAPLPPPAYISALDGPATIEREGALQPAALNLPVVAGDRVRTTTGRVEIRFPDGSGIEIGEYSEIEMETATRVRLLAGTMDRLDPEPAPSVASGYLPPDLQPYSGTLSQYGSWSYDAPYGYVWYPTVAPDWRPYYYGMWSPVPTYGWTWVGLDVWSWPTHHYGRWGYARSRWFWIPGATWGPAWVSWASLPDYVSWCPLGFDSRPVFALSIGYTNTWLGWTVLPREHFGAFGYYAHRNAIDPRRFTRDTPFIVQPTPPIAVRVADRRADSRLAPVPVPRREPSYATPPHAAPSYSAPSASAPVAVPRRAPAPTPAVTAPAPTPNAERAPDYYRFRQAVPREARPSPSAAPSQAPPRQAAPPPQTYRQATPVYRVPPPREVAPPPPPPARAAAPPPGARERRSDGSPASGGHAQPQAQAQPRAESRSDSKSDAAPAHTRRPR